MQCTVYKSLKCLFDEVNDVAFCLSELFRKTCAVVYVACAVFILLSLRHDIQICCPRSLVSIHFI